ncbi:polyunsaturated fatty acid 5-lipoxygenase-like [Polypterus senegalus]|uniref:polyunsaturated fatty acid 5-lipoxygenase-like n=1 Tax=Polypterus senegalus TaxID=55291 RepID=UPI0019663CE6|nr:polyunsaturated fatty acid 5-lipoxygenase-like [Polypterus senegalus]
MIKDSSLWKAAGVMEAWEEESQCERPGCWGTRISVWQISYMEPGVRRQFHLQMATYKLFVATGNTDYAGTMDYAYVTVIGKSGQSERKSLNNPGRDHCRGCVDEYDVCSKVLLEDIWFVELEKCFWVGDDWFYCYVEVKCPDGTCKIFPCYRWIVGNMTIRLRESSVSLCPSNFSSPIKAGTIHSPLQYIECARSVIKQKPHKNNPIFLPSDPELDWLLAKMWVRHAEFQVYEALSHLLRTHLVWEVFCIATMRQLPAVHPVYKLLIPHMRDTLQINTNARLTLISENGIFKQITSTGGEGLGLLLQKECQEIEFMSLLPKTDFEKRGVSQLKNYFYRDDCLKLWEAIESFVSGIVDLFYSSDKDVMEDKELQNWIQDVVTEGFKDLPNFFLPKNIEDKTGLVTILAGVIFTSSAQHAAINNGQYDWCSWVPNTPCTMRCPPPPQKGPTNMDLIINTFPNMQESCLQVTITWVLSLEQPTAVWLGQYPEFFFTEETVRDHIEKFQEALKKIEKSIDERNANCQLKYEYLNPRKIENSVAI